MMISLAIATHCSIVSTQVSTLYWYTSLERDVPIGILKYLYLPNGVPNVVSLLEFSSSFMVIKTVGTIYNSEV